jgi:phosphoserine phosphatase RsbU/P
MSVLGSAIEPSRVRILIVDDDDVDRENVLRSLPRAGIEAELFDAADPELALATVERERIELVFLDYAFPRHDGLLVLQQILVYDPSIAVIMLTGHDDTALAVELMKAGAVDYIPKAALSPQRLAQSVAHALRLRAAEAARRSAQEALRASEEFSRRILESSHDAIEVLDLDGNLVTVNPGGQRSFGVATALGRRDRSWLDLWGGTARSVAERALADARAGRTGRFQGIRATQSGEQLWWDVIVTPVLGLDERPDRLVAVSRDITEQKQQIEFEQQLIGIVSHDLRNPISAMVMAGMLLNERLPPGTPPADISERIVNSGQRAMRLIRDLLDFTQLRSSHGMPIERRSANLHQICKQAVDEAALANPSRILLHEATGEGQGSWDSDRLAQVVGNLTRNALSYSPEDSTVRVRSYGYGPSVSVEVHNEGEPIPSEIIPTLFRPFKRSARKLDSDRSIGLGLFIVREIVTAHRGTVNIRSNAGDGTMFQVQLPRW